MKTQFNGDDIRQLLTLSDTERQQVISFVEACENNSTLPAPAQNAPAVLQRMYKREVKRRKASARRMAKGEAAKKSKSNNDTAKLRDTIDSQNQYIVQLQESLEQFHHRLHDISSFTHKRNITLQEKHRAILFRLKKLYAYTEDLMSIAQSHCQSALLAPV